MITVNVTITCPYCGLTKKITSDSIVSFMHVRLCNPDDGGCDKYYAWKAVRHIDIDATSYPIAIPDAQKSVEPGGEK